MDQRAALMVVLVFLLPAAAALMILPAAGQAPPGNTTYTYKQVGTLEIKADVHLLPGRARPRPVVVYIHGGSLINGGRQGIEKQPLRDSFLAQGFAVVSIDYRLAPESRLSAILEDVEDAFRWVRQRGPRLFQADPGRVVAWGVSAGGYLTLAAGHRVNPRVQALVAEMSYGDLIGPWQRRPSIHPPHYETDLDAAEAWRQVAGPPIANVSDRRGNGSAFNDYCRRNAIWPKAISGWDPDTEAQKFLPYLPLRNVKPDYPATILIHGREDTDVPCEQAQLMAAELEKQGVAHRLILIAGGEHGYRGADPADVANAHRQALEFACRQVGRKSVAGRARPR